MDKKQFGVWAETQACCYLLAHGYRILDRNWRCRFGELDIVTEKDGIVHFVEVKARRSRRFGFGQEALTQTKLNRLLAAIVGYLGNDSCLAWQLDLIVIEKQGCSFQFDFYQGVG